MDKQERIAAEFFANYFLVGNCPNCGSWNTHDCEAPDFDVFPIVPINGAPKQIIKSGSECGVARQLDNPSIGHCDDCGYLWCLDCGTELSIENPDCGHWEICDKCYEDEGYLVIDDIIDKICKQCEFWDNANGCQLENPSKCEETKPHECPYEGQWHECPKIKAWKAQRK